MKKSKQNLKSGFTLVEVLISALIIAILVIGGSAALYSTGSSVVVQGNKRIALELANRRLELAKSNFYYDIAPDEYDKDDTYYLRPNTDDADMLEVTSANGSEAVTVGDLEYAMKTKVLRHSQAGGTVGFEPEALQITVTVEYRAATGETVELTTLLLPPEATG